jgi:CRISPR-associated protein Csd2
MMNEISQPIANRYDFVFFFDVTNGNPNGDPDAGNLPRVDPETNQGLVTDVCLKRKIRNYVELAKDNATGHRIYVTEGAILNEKHREAYLRERPDDKDAKTAKKLSPKNDEEALRLRQFMCDNFFDIRSFGGVLSTGINCGQVRGPVQFTFGRSVEAVMPLEISITRMAATNEAEKKKSENTGDDERSDNRTMGRKHIVPYGLYRAHGFISAPLAQGTKGTGFSEADLALLWEALGNMFDHDRSAARGEMSKRRLVVFKHENRMGNAPAHSLFDRVTVERVYNGEALPVGDQRTHNYPPARAFSDYAVNVDSASLPAGVEILDL